MIWAQNRSVDNLTNQGVSLVFDNDILKPKNQTDQYYSFGQMLSYYSVVNRQNNFFNKVFSPFRIDGKYVFQSELALLGYTPRQEDRQIIDRQFAGILKLKNSLIVVSDNEFLKLSAEMGIRGRHSGADKFQESLHKLLDSEVLEGWETQLPSRILFNIYGSWSRSVFQRRYFDLIPEMNVAIGNNQTYIKPNLQARMGWFNDLDHTSFYQTNIGSTTERKHNTEVYLLFQFYGKLSIVDATLNNERSTDGLIKAFHQNRVLGGYSLQFHVSGSHFDMFYKYHKATPISNIVPKHSYGTIGVAYRW